MYTIDDILMVPNEIWEICVESSGSQEEIWMILQHSQQCQYDAGFCPAGTVKIAEFLVMFTELYESSR